MKAKLNKYHILAVAMIIFLGGTIIFYKWSVLPLQQKVEKQTKTIRSKISRIKGEGYPLQHERLRVTLKRKKTQLKEIQDKSQEFRRLIINTFSKRIKENFGQEAVRHPETFERYVTRLDYQEFYNDIISKWKSRGIVLKNPVLNLGKNSVSKNIYRMVLKIWTLDTILDLALEEKLKVLSKRPQPKSRATEESAVTSEKSKAGAEKETISCISLLPVRKYHLTEQDATPYLLEFPLSMEVQCTTNQLLAFLEKLDSEKLFIALNHIEIKKQPAEKNDTNFKNMLEVTMNCSSFYPLKTKENQD